jgi:hypothetical protein
MVSVACLVVASLSLPGLTHPSLPSIQIRPLSAFVRALLADGARRSSTVARLVDVVERGPVTVYLDTDPSLAVRGDVSFVQRSRGMIVLVIRLNPRQTRDELIATLGHELRHVIEIASAPVPIASSDDLRRLYDRVGRSAAGGGFESEAAIAAERDTRMELGRRKR